MVWALFVSLYCFLRFSLTAILEVGDDETRAELRGSLDHAIAIYPHIDNAAWDTDSDETQESAITQLRYIIDSLFELASPLNDEREQMNSTSIDHPTAFYKELILEKFPNTPEYLVIRLAMGCRQYQMSLEDRKRPPPRTEDPTGVELHPTHPPPTTHEAAVDIHIVTASAGDTGELSIQQDIVSPAKTQSSSSSYSINIDKPAMLKRPDSVNGYICVHCPEIQVAGSMEGISMGNWRYIHYLDMWF